MDYTTVSRVKSELHVSSPTDDALLARLVTAASRAIDRKVTGVGPGSDDYFTLADVINEATRGQITNEGTLVMYPRKPLINSVAAVSFRAWGNAPMQTVDTTQALADGPRVDVWLTTILSTRRQAFTLPTKVYATISYNGGLAAATADLPDDVQEVAAMLTIRYYREAEGGMQDSIGVAELSQLIYTKAWPVRSLDMLKPYMRRIPWRGFP